MTKAFSDRVLLALDRRDIPPHVRRSVISAVLGPGAKNNTPPHLAWDNMRAPLQAHILSLRGNKYRVHAKLADLHKMYYARLLKANADILSESHSIPLPRDLSHWQAWIPEDERAEFVRAFQDAYAIAGRVRGNSFVPFAPLALRQETKERIKRLRKGIASAREVIPRGKDGRTKLLINALTLLACRQAELAVDKYEKALASGELHPYEAPAKVNWQHYCTAETRERVRNYYANGHITSEGLDSFWEDAEGEA